MLQKLFGNYKVVLGVGAMILLIGSLFAATIILKIERQPIGGAATAEVVTRVTVLHLTFNHTCKFALENSWNLISIPCSFENNSVEYALNSISGNYTSIHYYDPLNLTDPWKSYNPLLPGWVVQDLDLINIKQGYWIKMENASTYEENGNVTIANFIYLQPLWNLIGWPLNQTQNTSVAFESIAGQFGSVHMYNASDTLDPWKVYNPNIDPSLNDLEDINPYFGYWINASEIAVLQVIQK